MKLQQLTTILLILLPVLLQAQQTELPTSQYYLLGNVNLAGQSYQLRSNVYRHAFMATVGVGVGYEKYLSGTVSVFPKLKYIQKGSAKKLEGWEILPDFTYGNSEIYRVLNQFHYMAFDMLAKYNFRKTYKHMYYVQAGLRNGLLFSYLLNETPRSLLKRNSEYLSNQSYYPANTTVSGYNRYNLSSVTAVGLNIKQRFFIELERDFAINYLSNVNNIALRNSLWSVNVAVYWH